MKKLIQLFMILISFGIVKAQDVSRSINAMSTRNSTFAILDSAGVFTGQVEYIRGYNSLSITVRSDQAGDYKILFGHASVITISTATATYSVHYTANDTTHFRTYPVAAEFFKIIYTNTTVDQAKFYLVTMLNRGSTFPIDSDGNVKVAGTFTIPVDTLRYRGSIQLHSSTIAAGDSIGTIIKLGLFELPSLFYTKDTLKNIADTSIASYRYLKWYVFIGDTAGKSALSNWMILTLDDSGSVAYQAKLVWMKLTPVSPTVFYPLISDPATTAKVVYLKPYIVGGIQKAIALKLRTRYY